MTPRQFLAQYERDNAYDRYHHTYDRGLSPQVAKQLHAILIKSKADSSKEALKYFREKSQWNKWSWRTVGIYPEDTRKIYKILNVKMRHYLDDERNNPMKHNPKKTYIPTGKSAIRQAILKVLQKGNKSLATDSSNVTKTHIEKLLGNFPQHFTPASLKSGAKFIRAIRDKSKVDGKLLFGDGKKKDALTAFAKALDEGGEAYKASVLYRSPSAKYSRQAEQAKKVAPRDTKGKVMYQIPELFVVIAKSGGKERVLGGYANASSARSAAKAYIDGMKKAYDPLIASVITGKTPKGNISNRRAKLKVESKLYTKKHDGQARAGEATYKFENNSALQYLKDHIRDGNLIVKVVKVKDRKEHRAYWKLFDSPSVGQMRWNPKKR